MGIYDRDRREYLKKSKPTKKMASKKQYVVIKGKAYEVASTKKPDIKKKKPLKKAEVKELTGEEKAKKIVYDFFHNAGKQKLS